MGGAELGLAEGAVLGFPLRDRFESVPYEQRAPGCLGHPRGDADALCAGGREHLRMDLGSKSDSEFGRWVPSGHT